MRIIELNSTNLKEFRGLMALFSEAFEDPHNYSRNIASDSYVQALLQKEHMIFLTALKAEKVIGGLVAYVLDKFEQERSEVYIYDLAVASEFRRQGVATQLIVELQRLSKERGAYTLFVQADYEDAPAIKLYESLGVKEEVLHFDIKV